MARDLKGTREMMQHDERISNSLAGNLAILDTARAVLFHRDTHIPSTYLLSEIHSSKAVAASYMLPSSTILS